MSLDSYFDERVEIAGMLKEAVEPSLLNIYQTDLPKILVLAVASRFERDVVAHIEAFFKATSEHDSAAIFVKKKALTRQYHQLFDWKTHTVSMFVAYFGPECVANFKEMLKSHEWLEKSIRDFMLLGRIRNELVHLDLASYSMSLTPKEVQEAYASAARFVEAIPFIIRVEALP